MMRLVFLLLLQLPVGVLSATEAGLVSHQPEEQTNQEAVDSPSRPRFAPATRVEQRRRLREERLKEVPVPRSGPLEGSLLWLEKRGLDLLRNVNYKRFHPRFGGLPTGAGGAFGTRYWNPDLKDTFFDLAGTASLSTRHYQLYDLQFGEIPQFGEVRQKSSGFFLYGNLGYRDFTQEDFFGVGPDSRLEDRTNYRLKQGLYQLTTGYRLTPALYLDAHVGLNQFDLAAGTDEDYPDVASLFQDENTPGLEEEPDFLVAGSSLSWDLRDRPGNPHRGFLLRFGFSRYEGLDTARFDFTRYQVEGRHYLPLGSNARVLALRFASSFDNPDEGARTPFYLQRALGGGESLRGFRDYRFRDDNQLLLSAEYRWEAVPALELALFYGAGKVFSDREDFDLGGLRKSFGGGIRLKTPESVVVRVDVGRTSEGAMLYVRFRPSF